MVVYKRNNHKITLYQRKKHIDYMTYYERQYLAAIVAQKLETERLTLSKHMMQGLLYKRRKYSPKMAYKALEDIDVCLIEYSVKRSKNGYQEPRILVRSQEPMFYKNSLVNMCFAIQLDTFQVITAFVCEIDDNHDTLDPHRYSTKLDIVDTLKGINI